MTHEWNHVAKNTFRLESLTDLLQLPCSDCGRTLPDHQPTPQPKADGRPGEIMERNVERATETAGAFLQGFIRHGFTREEAMEFMHSWWMVTITGGGE